MAFDQRYDGLASLGAPLLGLESAPVSDVRVTFPFVNGVDGRSQGLEVSPDWKHDPSGGCRAPTAISGCRSTTRGGLTNTVFRDTYVGGSPRHQVRVQSRLDLPGRMEFDQTYRYVGALTGPDVEDYHGLDARLGWAATPALELSLVAQNLFDPHHQEFAAVPVEIRRSAYVQVTWRR